MVITEVEEVFLRYKKQEEKIEVVLRAEASKHKSLNKFNETQPLKMSFEEAVNRNKQILKELEVVKGNLRSKAIFSPTELQWEKVCEEYQNSPSLPVSTWHCHLPVFV